MKNAMNDMGAAPQLTSAAKANQRSAEVQADARMHSHAGERGREPMGANPAPTKAPLASRSASPPSSNTSGMERAMAAHADKVHPTRRR